jgi:hypothetical protein
MRNKLRQPFHVSTGETTARYWRRYSAIPAFWRAPAFPRLHRRNNNPILVEIFSHSRFFGVRQPFHVSIGAILVEISSHSRFLACGSLSRRDNWPMLVPIKI